MQKGGINLSPQAGFIALLAYWGFAGVAILIYWLLALLLAGDSGPLPGLRIPLGLAGVGSVVAWFYVVRASKLTPGQWLRVCFIGTAPAAPADRQAVATWGCAGAIVALLFLGALANRQPRQGSPAAASSSSVVVSGDEAVTSTGTFLCANEEASRALSRIKPGDEAALSRLLSSGSVDLLPAGTLVRVTASHLATKEVVVLSGGATGKRGTVPVEHVRAK